MIILATVFRRPKGYIIIFGHDEEGGLSCTREATSDLLLFVAEKVIKEGSEG